MQITTNYNSYTNEQCMQTYKCAMLPYITHNETDLKLKYDDTHLLLTLQALMMYMYCRESQYTQ